MIVDKIGITLKPHCYLQQIISNLTTLAIILHKDLNAVW